MRKAILTFVVIILVLAGLTTYFMHNPEINIEHIFTLSGMVLVLAFAFIVGWRRFRSIRKDQPSEDEFSKRILNRSASTSYYISLYTWLALMLLSDRIDIPVSSQFGLGILVMAVIFALSWFYYNYTGKINE